MVLSCSNNSIGKTVRPVMVSGVPQQFIVDAFEDGPFTGNPAAVVPLENWLEDDIMQSIAAENNLSETAFFVPEGDSYGLRWFTPTAEVPLCGHATLASAHVYWTELHETADAIAFETKSGTLRVTRGSSANSYTLDFPLVRLKPHDAASEVLSALGIGGEVLDAGEAAFVITDPLALRTVDPDLSKLEKICGMAIVTSPADAAAESRADVMTRVFAPAFGIPEDPATGSAHCAVAPYWSDKLGKQTISSFQASDRGGYFECEVADDRVLITGTCRTFARGELAGF